jgi:hypothetical protein
MCSTDAANIFKRKMHVARSTIFTVFINLAHLEAMHSQMSSLFEKSESSIASSQIYCKAKHLPVLAGHVLGEWWKWAVGDELGLRSLSALAFELPVQPLDDKWVPTGVDGVSGILTEEDGLSWVDSVKVSLALFLS